MKKIVIYVEGLTELAFVRQLLWNYYDCNKEIVRIECYNIDTEEISKDISNLGNDNAPIYYMIYH